MDAGMMSSASDALLIMLDPYRLMALGAGVIIGLTIGVIPGLGGIVGLAILIPFTYAMDPYAAFAFLLGMASVTTTSDTIPAVLFGVPGTVGSAATVMDGHPLARQGQAGRAFGAAYAASLAGGLVGALLLGFSIPLLRPLVLYIGSPELLALTIFGLSMVSVLSGKAPARGIAAAGFGLLLAMIGAGPQTGTLRWTFDSLYLWDGLPLIPVTLGLFALPELVDMAVRRSSIASEAPTAAPTSGLGRGMKDAWRHRWLVLRCGWLGAALGTVPGMGSAVIDWIAYGHAARSERNTENFGKGDIRGVISSESANNAKEGGALVPTIVFGVPGSASMALLLAAFLIHGLTPGPEMLNRHLDVTYAIVWSVALANILGVAICLGASPLLARIASLRFSIILPVVTTAVLLGAFQGERAWGDLVALLLFGAIGWGMKQFSWPRPPLILGFVLGDLFERYSFISVERYGFEWLTRPIVLIILVLALWGVWRPLRDSMRLVWKVDNIRQGFRFDSAVFFTVSLVLITAGALTLSSGWPSAAAFVPRTVAIITLIAATIALAVQVLYSPKIADTQDVAITHGRAARFFAWLLGFLLLILLVGFLPAAAIFIASFMMVVGREGWRLSASLSAATIGFAWLIFDQFLALPWPESLLGDLLPSWRAATGLL